MVLENSPLHRGVFESQISRYIVWQTPFCKLLLRDGMNGVICKNILFYSYFEYHSLLEVLYNRLLLISNLHKLHISNHISKPSFIEGIIKHHLGKHCCT